MGQPNSSLKKVFKVPVKFECAMTVLSVILWATYPVWCKFKILHKIYLPVHPEYYLEFQVQISN